MPLIEPKAAGRHGPLPVIKGFSNYEQECEYIVSKLRKLHDQQNLAWSEMCITYRANWMGQILKTALAQHRLPFELLCDSWSKKAYQPSVDSIKVMTMHSSKGLEFPLVVVSGIGNASSEGFDVLIQTKLLYVAMTRSTNRLLLTFHKESRFTQQLQGLAKAG